MVCQAGDTNYFSFLVNGLRYLSTLWLGRNYLLGASVHRDLPLFHLRDQFYDLYFLEQNKVRFGWNSNGRSIRVEVEGIREGSFRFKQYQTQKMLAQYSALDEAHPLDLPRR